MNDFSSFDRTTPADETAAPEAEPAVRRPAPHHRPRIVAFTIAGALLLTGAAGAGAWALTGPAAGPTTTAVGGTQSSPFGGTSGSGQGSSGQGFGSQGFGGQGFGGQGFGGGSSSGSTSGQATVNSTTADTSQVRGVVTIVSELGYEDGEAAGTGIVLSSSGRILTNNHVISGATSIRVTDESTGATYTARVVGTDATADIAVLQLQNASGLTTATLATKAAADGDSVTAIGNAEGTGTLTAADGSVTDTGQRITTQSEGSAKGEILTGLIETSADVVSGDSGGPLENAAGQVVGITTAATSGTADITGYAIPISTALSVAEQIVNGQASDEVTIGLPAFLGVSMSQDTSGAVVAEILNGTPAAGTGLAAGDTITAIGTTAVDSADALSAAIATHQPGDSVTVTWTDTSGASHSATVTLVEGPAN